jgi:hypothetical protein
LSHLNQFAFSWHTVPYKALAAKWLSRLWVHRSLWAVWPARSSINPIATGQQKLQSSLIAFNPPRVLLQPISNFVSPDKLDSDYSRPFGRQLLPSSGKSLMS